MEKAGGDKDKNNLILRLKRVEGQLRGIQQLVQSEADCEEIAHQIHAARRALDKSFYAMIACAYRHHFAGKLAGSAKLRKGVEKMNSILTRFS